MPFDVSAFRKRMALTQEELAHKLHVDVKQIRRWERYGVSPRPHRVARMKQMEMARTMGQEAALPRAVPLLPVKERRRVPGPSIATGDPSKIGVTPSSF